MTTTRVHAGQKGFTLIELLIVIAIIGFLAAAVLVAVDPVKRIQGARDARRFSEANAILNAILTKQVDDRKLFYGLGVGTAGMPVIASGPYSQVIIEGDNLNEVLCDDVSTYPTCTNVDLDDGGTDKVCVAALGGLMTGTATSTLAVLDGSASTPATAFDEEAVVGDTLVSASGGTCIIDTITDFETITCTATPSPVFAGVVYNRSKSIVPEYIAEIPIDPRGAGEYIDTASLALGSTNSGYYIHLNPGNRIEVGACLPEDITTNPTIKVKR